jgi:hypothetical protein
MLIRLVGHNVKDRRHEKNPHAIDKLFVVNGLPEEWMFRKTPDGGKEIVRPWEADVDANIPVAIRHLCEKTEITQRFSPIEKGAQGFTDKRIILGLRLDLSNQPAKEMWERVEDYIERSLPRDERFPSPRVVAKDHREAFSLEPDQIPVVNLLPKVEVPLVTRTVVETPAAAVFVPKEETFERAEYKCPEPECGMSFPRQQGLRMHNTKRHRKEKVGA